MTDNENPFKRIVQYSRPNPAGGITIDIQAMACDLIAAAKMGGYTLDVLIEGIRHEWPLIEAVAEIPNHLKN